MNLGEALTPARYFAFRAWRALAARVPGGRVRAFGRGADQIGAIIVVNLDRQPRRWHRVTNELGRFRTSDGDRLTSITRRLAAIDARDGRAVAATADVDPIYRIGDQLYVQPDSRLAESFAADEPVRMTRQEVAVARSHVEAWKAVAAGPQNYVLVLEDDAWFKPGAKSAIERGWRAALGRLSDSGAPHLLYLSYMDAGGTALREEACRDLFRPVRGLWFLSGYVLSREGAATLLRAMPVVGPVDLWMNYRFVELGALALTSPAIGQRHDSSSDNAYSVMPYLARAGVVDGGHGSRPPGNAGSDPVVAWTGCAENESLAMALSMLGMRVRVFDSQEEPLDHFGLSAVLQTFDALVDPPLTSSALSLVAANENMTVLLEADAQAPDGLDPDRLAPSRSAVLKSDESGGLAWAHLCELLGVDKPVEAFPVGAPRTLRLFRDCRPHVAGGGSNRVDRVGWPMDDSPWVLPSSSRWQPAQIKNRTARTASPTILEASMADPSAAFPGLTETFPGNLASFAPENLTYGDEGVRLQIDVAEGGLRPFRSGALASVRQFAYGRFQAEIRAARGPGLITGFFLHRGAPRQEIDIEFAGSDPRRMLTNVFFNPGDDGAAIAFGYRGSPCWIDLGFDASEGFHEYAVEWRPDCVTWFVDGAIVHQRTSWDPTPIPHLGMTVHANLWAPRSHELAGRINERMLPADALFRNIRVFD